MNLRLSAGVQWRLPKHFTFPFTLLYEQQTLFLGNRLEAGTILDIGAGFLTPTNKSKGLKEGINVIGMDISETALKKNRDVDFRIVGDACAQWPLADASVDMVISR
jgi:hypothetical protein